MNEVMMWLGFFAIVLAGVLSFGVYLRPLWEQRQVVFSIVVLCTSLGFTTLLLQRLTFWSVAMVAIGGYIVVNAMRAAYGRMHELHLKRVTLRSFVVLWPMSAVLIAVYFMQPSSSTALIVYLVTCVAAASIVLVNTVDRLMATRSIVPGGYSDPELPTLSVAIAARNETATLGHCLEAVLASDYPKLEVLVLDDCSQDRTAQIIREFAHRGVRFVQGEPPHDETWLQKNKAYDKLLNEATGEFILYMGVDVRLKPTTIRQIVGHMLTRQLDMVSILPQRTHSGLLAAVIQPMRYWWELAIPRFRDRPPVLSTLWCAERRVILEFGGFQAVKRAIVPETHLAQYCSRRRAYAFLRHSAQLPVTTHKSFVSQWLTAIRTRYPQLRRRPEAVFVQGGLMVLFLAAPYVLLPIFIIVGVSAPYSLLTLLSVLQLSAAHTAIQVYTNPSAAWFAPLMFPVAVITDLVALHISMWRYEFGIVEWKGRNVCEPVMHVYASLPPLTKSSPELVDR